MNASLRWLAAPCICVLVSVMLSACVEGATTRGAKMHELELGKVLATEHRGHDDLLSAGLGLSGLAGLPAPFANPLAPTAAELRRRAIQASWKGIADLGPLGGYGRVYGGVPDVPGREYQMFARLPGARSPHRVLLQLPDGFDHAKRCLVVTASSGSRGIYGAIAVAGAWGLPRGCAVAYTDKGTGSGYFDYSDDSGVALDGRRAKRGEQELEFEPPPAGAGTGIAVKHAHSGDNPEADWGRDVIQAAQFGLTMLDRAYPGEAPFTAQNTKIIATGISNGGGAVLQAAGLDHDGFFAGVVALEPNVYAADGGRPLYDYATEAAIWLPCALADARFDDTPMARGATRQPPPAWSLRCASLRAQGKLQGSMLAEQSAQARHYLQQRGWNDAAMATAASTTAFDLWRVVTAGYASAYLRRGPADMPCGFHYAPMGAGALPGVTDPMARAAWWADASGIPPGNGVGLFGGVNVSPDPTLLGEDCLRALWTGDEPAAQMLQASIAATAAKLPRADLPLWVVHGADDGLLPTAFTSEPYAAWLREEGRRLLYWKVPHAQHFDAFLPLPGFGERHLPLLPYGYAALDRLWAHLYEGAVWPTSVPTPAGHPRGASVLTRESLGLD
ncbi:3-hydroxybutyrate oligomer hydrolase family protein [Rhodanobacter sp. UC4451_H18]